MSEHSMRGRPQLYETPIKPRSVMATDKLIAWFRRFRLDLEDMLRCYRYELVGYDEYGNEKIRIEQEGDTIRRIGKERRPRLTPEERAAILTAKEEKRRQRERLRLKRENKKQK